MLFCVVVLLVDFLPFLMLLQMIGLYQYALETEVSACFGILFAVIEIALECLAPYLQP